MYAFKYVLHATLIFLLRIQQIIALSSFIQGHIDQRGSSNTSNLVAASSASAESENCDICIIAAPGGVRLIYWQPDNASNFSYTISTPGQPYTQVENGFTFTSPSVYVVYSSLQATTTCKSFATVGPSFVAKTIGYSSSFLAYGTLNSPDTACNEFEVVGGFHTINFDSLYYSPIITSITTKPGCPPYVNPRLSLPAELTNVDLAWTTCQPQFDGAFDPPSYIRKAGELAPTAGDGGQITSNDPSPATMVTAVAQASFASTTLDPTPMADNGVVQSKSTGKPQITSQLVAPAMTPANSEQTVTDQLPKIPGNLSPQQVSQLHQALQPAESFSPTPVDNQQVSQANAVMSKDGSTSVQVQSHSTATPVPLFVDPKEGALAEDSSYNEPVVPVTTAENVPTSKLSVTSETLQKDPQSTYVVSSDGPLILASSNAQLATLGALSVALSTTAVSVSQLNELQHNGHSGQPTPLQSANDAPGIPSRASPSPYLFNGNAIQKASDGGLLVAGQSIAPGDQANINGATISNPAGADNIVVDGATHKLWSYSSSIAPSALALTTPLLIGTDAVQKASDGTLTVGSLTIWQGDQATYSGVAISNGMGNVVIGGTTYAIVPSAAEISINAEGLVEDPAYSSSNILTRLTSGGTFQVHGMISTYSGLSASVLTIPTEVPVTTSNSELSPSETGFGGIILSAFNIGAMTSTALPVMSNTSNNDLTVATKSAKISASAQGASDRMRSSYWVAIALLVCIRDLM